MRVIIAGGSGQVGTILARSFHAGGDEVVVLSRSPRGASWRVAPWDANTIGPWTREIERADVVINLAGRSVNCRYTEANKRAIMDSRVNSTRVMGEAISRASMPPRLWLQASTATVYAHRFDAPNDEATGLLGGSAPGGPPSRPAWGFSVEVARAWEGTLDRADTPHTRRVALRSSMVMSPDRGGIFDTLLGLVRRGLGGTAGSGRQYLSWIHHEDFTRAMRWLIAHDDISGAVNVTAPHPVPNADFMRALRQAAGVRVGLPATEWMLAVGAVFLRTETELILKSRRVAPGRLLRSGFEFRFPEWEVAARDLCVAWHAST